MDNVKINGSNGIGQSRWSISIFHSGASSRFAQPAILDRLNKTYNKRRNFDLRVKPFGFVQTIVPDRQDHDNDVLPMAPFDKDVRKSMRLPWVDFNTGKPICIDWHGSAMAGSIGVMSLCQYIQDYQRHSESEAADRFGNPAGVDTTGILGDYASRRRPW